MVFSLLTVQTVVLSGNHKTNSAALVQTNYQGTVKKKKNTSGIIYYSPFEKSLIVSS